MNAKASILLVAVLVSAVALAGSGQQAQAEERTGGEAEKAERLAQKAKERAERLVERAKKRAGGAAERAKERTEEAEKPEGGHRDSEEVTLKIEGDWETRFSGTCAIGKEEPIAISGGVPQSFAYTLQDGQKLECKIRKQNTDASNLKVILTGEDDERYVRQQADAQNAIIKLTYEDGDASSSISSSSGGRVASSSSSQAVSSSSSR